MRRLPSLDGFRAISIILVLLCHIQFSTGFPKEFRNALDFGGLGVSVFFVISGFLITYLLLDEKERTGQISIKSFYTRRAFRILPVFLLYLLFIIVWNEIENVGLTKENILHSLTFSVNFLPIDRSWYISHFWSLSVEEQFYLLWPAMLIFFRKHLKIMLFVFICYSCVCRAIVYKAHGYDTILLHPYFSVSDAIMTGAFGGVLYFQNKSIIQLKIFRSFVLQLLAVILMAATFYCSAHGRLGIVALPFGNLIDSISILFLIFAYLRPSNNLLYKFLNSKLMVHIGILSYSIYVWQQFFVTGSDKYFFRVLPYNIFVIYFVSLASYYLLEQPLIKLGKTFLNKRQALKKAIPIKTYTIPIK